MSEDLAEHYRREALAELDYAEKHKLTEWAESCRRRVRSLDKVIARAKVRAEGVRNYLTRGDE